MEFLLRTRVPMTWHQSMGHKGPVLRARCIGPERDQTQLLFYFDGKIKISLNKHNIYQYILFPADHQVFFAMM